MRKFNGFGKRQVTLAALVLLIGAAGYINLTHTPGEDALPASGEAVIEETPPPAADDYFTASRLERERSRSAAMDICKEVVNNPQGTSDAKANAQNDLAAFAKAIETEAVLEGLIKAKGFDDVIVYLADGNANVVVKTIGLTPAQAAQIKDLIVENAKIKADKIKIVEV
ncbi:MAG: SpoIIIAH-like family protein [Clostridiales bacterium]|jgi:stage III sporulation protein AH|nr:SpoIIIAH-like family protein [Clostridiales bacterium]